MTTTRALGTTFAAFAVSASLFSTTDARADEREQCASAADQAQQLRDEGKYRRAREQFLLCARDACPGPIKKDCLDWLSKVDDVAPTVVFAAKDGDRDISDVKVLIDGVQITEKLDGKPLLVDTGEHSFKFEHGGEVKEQKVLITAGQKGRNISVQFGAAKGPGPGSGPAPEQPRGEGSLVPALVLGGVGVVALGSFAYFALSGMSAKKDFDDSNCKPNCAQSDVDSVKTKLLIGDISLGVGVVAIGIATYLVVTRPHLEDHVNVKTGRREPPKGLSDVKLDVAPLPGGGAATFGASF